MTGATGIVAAPPPDARGAEILGEDALAFLAALDARFEPRRRALLDARVQRRARIAAGGTLDFRPETAAIRAGDWQVAPPPAPLRDRRVEITGPVDRKLMINALNSGARGFMADFEDALSPTWANVVAGHANVRDAARGTLAHVGPDGREYRLAERTATLLVRPRGWHLPEKHVTVDGRPLAAALVDAGLFLFHCAHELLARDAGPYLYLPKLESHEEAQLWDDVLASAEQALGLDRGTAKTTVLIETLPAAFEMEEVLHALRDRSPALNAGRWDYIFSTIKTFRERPEFVLPDRGAVTMTVPFMRAYTELLVRTCHRRGALAIGGMAALVPSRRDPAATARAIAAVAADKRREAGDGFDGTWVAHPDVVATARAEFDAVLGDRPNQLDRRRDDVEVGAAELLDVAATPGAVTEAGLRANVAVALEYLAAWLGGHGAVAIRGLMEDAATAEIARAQAWQWVRHGAALDDGRPVTAALVRRIAAQELARLREAAGDGGRDDRPRAARDLFERVALDAQLAEFLTLPAYERLA